MNFTIEPIDPLVSPDNNNNNVIILEKQEKKQIDIKEKNKKLLINEICSGINRLENMIKNSIHKK
jgi:hypothetical protein